MKKYLKRMLLYLRGEQNLDKLVKRGLVLGKGLTRMGGVIIDPAHCWHITIGDDVILAPNVHILAHDASTKLFLNYTRVADVRIGNKVFIGAGSIILPGVVIGDNVIVGAGSVVSKSIPEGHVAVGNPARVVCTTDEYVQKQQAKMGDSNCFDESYTLRNPHFGIVERDQMLTACKKDQIIFVE